MLQLADLQIVVAIMILEGLLSVDNALVNASLALQLPRREQKLAVGLGLAIGAGLRLVALFCVSLIIRFAWVKLIGAAYLVYLAVTHLWSNGHKKSGSHQVKTRFSSVIISIGLADLAFSLDNVVAAVGMSPKFPVVVIGVMAGIVTMVFATQIVTMMVRRYPLLARAAYVIVGYIGLTIIGHELLGVSIEETAKFLSIISIVGLTVAYEEVGRVHRRRVAQSLVL